MKTVILAGGKGLDLYPLTETRPKPMITLLGKPILQYLIEELQQIGLNDIVIVVGYKGEQIKEYFKNGLDFNVNIQYADQGEKEGIESALLAAEEFVANDSEFLLLFGDIVPEKGLMQRALNAFENTQADMTMTLTLRGDTGDFGIVEIDSMGMVIKAGIKKINQASESKYVDAGCFIIRTDIFDEIRTQQSLSKAINARIEKGDKVSAAIWEKEWVDIGKPWNIIEANRLLLSNITESRIAKDVSISTNVELKNAVIIEKNVEISSGTVLNGPVYIGANTYLGNNVLIRDHCSIGKGSLIGFGSEIKNSVLFDEAKVFRLCYIGDSVIGQNTSVSSGVMTVITETGMKEVSMNINGKKVSTGLLKLGAIIGDNCDIGVNTLIFPGRKISSNSVVEPGTTIKDDYESEKRGNI
ncbi:MAG: NTP transferase domain-containing protein [Candidatus Heimdallarchaeota archaeon]|nr:NTP transferase domain-containing protein [Candidatus Heimdallarchaeota archaeon]